MSNKSAALSSKKVWVKARELMGEDNIITPRQIKKHLNIVFSKRIQGQLNATLEKATEFLRELKDSHFLFIGLPYDAHGNRLTFLRLLELYREANIPLHDGGYSWDGTDEVSNKICDFGLYLISKEIPEDTYSREFNEAKMLINRPMECSRALEILCCDYQLRKVLGRSLLTNKGVLCPDKAGLDSRVFIEFISTSLQVKPMPSSLSGSEIGTLPILKLLVD